MLRCIKDWDYARKAQSRLLRATRNARVKSRENHVFLAARADMAGHDHRSILASTIGTST